MHLLLCGNDVNVLVRHDFKFSKSILRIRNRNMCCIIPMVSYWDYIQFFLSVL